MNSTKVEGAIGLVTTASVVLALGSWHAAKPLSPHLDLPGGAGASITIEIEGDALAQAAIELAERNPFRLSNQPSRVRHGEDPVAVASVAERYRPHLHLSAIVGGPPWTALLAGVPGTSGVTLIRAGDTVDSVHVESIVTGRVVLRGPDTTWVLTIERGNP